MRTFPLIVLPQHTLHPRYPAMDISTRRPFRSYGPFTESFRKSSSEEEEEVHDKVVLHSSIILGTCNDWNTLFNPGTKCCSSPELPANFQTGEFPRNLRLSHSSTPVKIPIYSQNPGCIMHGDVYSAVY